MSIFFEILVRIESYGTKIDQSHGENRLSHIIMHVHVLVDPCIEVTLRIIEQNNGDKLERETNGNTWI